MILNLKKTFKNHLLNIPGWRTDRKIIVIESDDWGSIRMPSKTVYDSFLKKGIPVDKSPYCKYDSLASEDDLISLFEVLTNYQNSSGFHPIITANAIVANPDFEKIRESEFHKYFYSTISDTFANYPKHGKCLSLWKDGLENKVFYPQFHGREHLNVHYWLKLLRNNEYNFRSAFDNGFWGLSRDVYPGMKRSIQAAFDLEDSSELEFHSESIRDGCRIFEQIFGYKSRSFIASNFIWSPKLNQVLSDVGVIYMQGMKYQKLPLDKDSKRQMIRHYLGEYNQEGQYYLVRNCVFEPSLKKPDFDNVGQCLKQIRTAFFWNKPAIITSHRINYVGFLDEENRDKNLRQLDLLLKRITSTWPDVEFMTSVDLGNMILEDIKKVRKLCSL